METGEIERAKPLTWAFYDALNERRVAMRTDDWKILASLKSETATMVRLHNIYDGNLDMIKNAELTDFVLCNMKEDIREAEDVSLIHPEVFEEMKGMLKSEYATLVNESHIWRRD